MNRTTRRTILIVATAFVWLAAGAASVGRFKLAAKPPLVISLGTKPANVKVHVDGEKQFEGTYVETPVKVTMPPGKHKLKISRDGFIAHLVSVEGDAGEVFKMEDVVLQRNANFSFATVEVAAEAPHPVHVEIDDGLERGDTPFSSGDVTADQAHVLSVFPKWPEREPRFRCKFFVAPGENDTEPTFTIQLKVKGGRVRSATNCEKLGKTSKK